MIEINQYNTIVQSCFVVAQCVVLHRICRRPPSHYVYISVEYLHTESSDIEGLKFVKQNGVQILSIQKTQVLTTHE